MGNYKLEKLIYSKILFFYNTRTDCDEFFDSLKEIKNEIHGKCSGTIKLNKSDKPVHYDSTYEKKVLEDLDKCSFVKRIKTQSYMLEYNGKSLKKKRKYIPDIQILLNDGRMVIIEIKPFKEMVNSRNMKKYKILRKHCKENRIGFAFIDRDYYSFEDIKNENVTDELKGRFIAFIKTKGKASFSECKEFKKKYRINDKQICNIIFTNKRRISYMMHVIRVKKDYKKIIL